MYGRDMIPGYKKSSSNPTKVITTLADEEDDDYMDDDYTKDSETDEDDSVSSEGGSTADNAPMMVAASGTTDPSASDSAKMRPGYAKPTSDWLCDKFKSRNKATPGGCYKGSSYDGARRGNTAPSGWDKYFDQNNDIIGGSQNGAPQDFLPVDESGGNLAVFKSTGGPVCGSNQGCQPEDLFDVDKYLPQEVNDDWFEVQPEPVSVKNRHLINITKPLGVNTIGTSLKNSSYDIRGSVSCPKSIVSPWGNSSIEADSNLKPLF